MEAPTESVVTNDPLLTATADATVPVTITDTLAVTDGQSGLITNDAISSQACPAVVAATHDPVDAVADAPGFSGANDPIVTDDPLLTAAAGATVSVTEPDTLGVAEGPVGLITNDAISSQASPTVVPATDDPVDVGTAAPIVSECEVIGCDVGPSTGVREHGAHRLRTRRFPGAPICGLRRRYRRRREPGVDGLESPCRINRCPPSSRPRARSRTTPCW